MPVVFGACDGVVADIVDGAVFADIEVDGGPGGGRVSRFKDVFGAGLDAVTVLLQMMETALFRGKIRQALP
jgi:hypothetical protein